MTGASSLRADRATRASTEPGSSLGPDGRVSTSARVPLLSELREPPVVGRYYMVPVIDFPYYNRVDAWPTIGPLHHDRGDLIGFHPLHFHVDVRFLTGRQAQHLRRRGYYESVEMVVTNTPLNRTDLEVPRKPRLERRRCRVSSWQWTPPGPAPWIPKFDARYGKIAEPIRIKGDRLLCPHRKADLSSFPPDADGIVTCPLHGLRVRCAQTPSQDHPHD